MHRFFTWVKRIEVIATESAVKYSFVQKCIQTRRQGYHKVEWTLASRLHVKQLITAITAIHCKHDALSTQSRVRQKCQYGELELMGYTKNVLKQ